MRGAVRSGIFGLAAVAAAAGGAAADRTRGPGAIEPAGRASVGTLVPGGGDVRAGIPSRSARSDAAATQASEGKRIRANDGDIILLEAEANVRIVRRRPAIVRAIFDAGQRWLLVLADFPPAGSTVPDGVVDRAYTFQNVTGSWPLGPRWDGEAVVQEYRAVESPGNSIGLETPFGLVQVLGAAPADPFRDPSAVALLTASRSGWASIARLTFDAAEQAQMEALARDAGPRPLGPSASTGGVVPGTPQAAVAVSPGAPAPQPGRAMRVGGRIAAPRKVHDVPAELPEAARRAGVRGVVLLDLTIGTDGAVSEARVLRGIPLLDQAALDAARQWRYEPALLDGRPVPVVMTAAVGFE